MRNKSRGQPQPADESSPPLAKQRQARRPLDRVLVYTATVTLIGLAVLVAALNRLPGDLYGLLLFASMAAIAELLGVELFESSRSYVSVSSIISIASILVLGPLAGVLTTAVSAIATSLPDLVGASSDPKRASWLQRAGFNLGMFVIASAVGGGVYVLLGGTPGAVWRVANLLPLVGLAAADAIANLGLLIGVIALQTGQRPAHIWQQDFAWATPILIAGGILGGGALALSYSTLGLLGPLVFFLPVLATSYSLRLYVAHTKEYVNRLEQLNRDLDRANLGLLETLGAVIDADDMYTYGHSKQVAVYAGALGARLNLPPAERDTLVRAALVHDIGKIAIQDSILGKQEPLTIEEYNIVKRHPIIGAEIIGRMQGLNDLVPLVRHHHERWDGKGYPDGLKGKEIPIGARILALVDSLDAIYSDRPYRRTKNQEEIKQELANCAGTQFDPALVQVVLEMLAEKGQDLFKNSAASVDRDVLVQGLGPIEQRVPYLKRSMIDESTT